MAPDPHPCLVLEQQTVDNIDEHTLGWTEINSISGPIGGDISWPIDLGRGAAGDESSESAWRVTRVATPSAGADLRPDEDCAVPFSLYIDTYEPNLLSMSVFLGGADVRKTGAASTTRG